MNPAQPAETLLDQTHLFNGFWTWDVKHNRIYGCQNLINYFGFTMEAASSGLALTDYTDRIDRRDRGRVNDAITKAIVERHPYRETYQVHTRSHGVRRILAQGRCYYDERDLPCSFPGWFVDVTDEAELGGTPGATPLLLAQHLAGLAREAAAQGRHKMLVYFLDMALMQARDDIKLVSAPEKVAH